MRVIINRRMNAYKLVYCFSCYYNATYLHNQDFILLLNKAFRTQWNTMVQKYEFPKMHHCIGFLQIRSHMSDEEHFHVKLYIRLQLLC